MTSRYREMICFKIIHLAEYYHKKNIKILQEPLHPAKLAAAANLHFS